MQTRWYGLCGLVAMTLHGTAEWSLALPPDFTLVWKMHDTPSDPQTPVVFATYTKLHAISQSGNTIRWAVTSQEAFTVNEHGQIIAAWVCDDVAVNTADALWWVNHGNPNSPVTADFLVPPHMYGLATAVTTGYEDLDFSVEGTESSPPNPEPYEDTAMISFWWRYYFSQVPVEEGDDAPVQSQDEDGLLEFGGQLQKNSVGSADDQTFETVPWGLRALRFAR